MDEITKIQKIDKIVESFRELITMSISSEELALNLRRFQNESIYFALKDEEQIYNKVWLEDGTYWLNELCEIIDPYLTKEI